MHSKQCFIKTLNIFILRQWIKWMKVPRGFCKHYLLTRGRKCSSVLTYSTLWHVSYNRVTVHLATGSDLTIWVVYMIGAPVFSRRYQIHTTSRAHPPSHSVEVRTTGTSSSPIYQSSFEFKNWQGLLSPRLREHTEMTSDITIELSALVHDIRRKYFPFWILVGRFVFLTAVFVEFPRTLHDNPTVSQLCTSSLQTFGSSPINVSSFFFTLRL
jgi:hypothetical protein